MNPEEDYNHDVWETLKRIKRESLATLKGQPVDFKLSTVVGIGIVGYRAETKILRQLEEWGAIKFATINPGEGGWEFPGNWVKLWLVEPKFGEVYEDFSVRAQGHGSGVGSGLNANVSLQVLISDLESKYQDILGEKAINRFYLKLADYGKCLNESEAAYPVLSELFIDSQKQIADLRSHWTEFFKIWKKYAEDLVKLADTVGIKDKGPLENELGKLRGYVSQPYPQFSDTELPNYWQPYKEVIGRFIKTGMVDKVIGEHLDEERNFKLYPEYRKVEVAWDKYKLAREISVWIH